MDHDLVQAYLRRIGAPPVLEPTLDVLRDLHLRHLRSVPFENLSIHLGEPIVLAPAALVDKIVRRRRGGFCYELNGAFAALLTSLGFAVRMLSARAFGDNGELGPPFDHLTLRVDIDGERWLADVGFGSHSSYPLRLDWPDPQPDPDGEFLLIDTPDGDVDVLRDGKPQYRLERRPRALADFVPTCWWQQTSPDSHFTRGLTCSLATADGRVTVSGNRKIVTVDGRRTETTMAGDAEILAAYHDLFGIRLDRVPAIAAADTRQATMA